MNREDVKKTISETLAALRVARASLTQDTMGACDNVIHTLRERPMIRAIMARQLGVTVTELNNSIDTAHKVNDAVKEIARNHTLDRWIEILEKLDSSPTAQAIIDFFV